MGRHSVVGRCVEAGLQHEYDGKHTTRFDGTLTEDRILFFFFFHTYCSVAEPRGWDLALGTSAATGWSEIMILGGGEESEYPAVTASRA